MDGSDVCLESSFLDPVLVLQLFEGDLHVLPQLALLVLIDKHDVLDPTSANPYFCLYKLRVIT